MSTGALDASFTQGRRPRYGATLLECGIGGIARPPAPRRPRRRSPRQGRQPPNGRAVRRLSSGQNASPRGMREDTRRSSLRCAIRATTTRRRTRRSSSTRGRGQLAHRRRVGASPRSSTPRRTSRRTGPDRPAAMLLDSFGALLNYANTMIFPVIAFRLGKLPSNLLWMPCLTSGRRATCRCSSAARPFYDRRRRASSSTTPSGVTTSARASPSTSSMPLTSSSRSR